MKESESLREQSHLENKSKFGVKMAYMGNVEVLPDIVSYIQAFPKS